MNEKTLRSESPSQDERILASFLLLMKLTLPLGLLLMLVVGCSTNEERIQRRVEALLQEGDYDAFEKIVDIGEPAVKQLIVALKHPDPSIRARSANALGEIGDPRAGDPIFHAFEQGSIRNNVTLDVLAELDHPRAVEAVMLIRADASEGGTSNDAENIIKNGGPEPLIRLLKHERSDVRWSALLEITKGEFLHSLEPEAALIVVDILTTEGVDTRSWEDEILAQMGPSAAHSLAILLEQDPSKLNLSAIRLLGRTGGSDAAEILVSSLVYAPRSMRPDILEALLDISEKEPKATSAALQTSLEPLITMAADRSDLALEYRAAQLLAYAGGPQSLEALLEGLAAYSGEERRSIFIKPLGELGDPGAITTLRPLLADDDEEIRRLAVVALANIDDQRVLDPLVQALGDNEREVRETAAYQLNRMDDRILGPLLEALQKREMQTIAEAYLFFLVRGEPGSEAGLAQALYFYGTEEMAVDFLNSGHEPLEKAAEEWAQDNGYIITGLPSFEASPTWPSDR